MEIAKYIVPVFGSALLCAGWIVVQMIARRMKTKNLFDNMPSCGHCVEETACGNAHCERSDKLQRNFRGVISPKTIIKDRL